MTTKIEVLVGLPGSGKSTYADRNISHPNLILSSDELRKEYPNYENKEIFNTLYEKLDIAIDDRPDDTYILDATNLTMKDRRSFFNNVDLTDVEVEAKVFNIPFWKCLYNNLRRERVVPHKVITRYRQNFQLPLITEGFDRISFITKFDNSISHKNRMDCLSKMDIEQHNPHHNQTVLEHCMFVRDMCFGVSAFKGNQSILEAALLHDFGK